MSSQHRTRLPIVGHVIANVVDRQWHRKDDERGARRHERRRRRSAGVDHLRASPQPAEANHRITCGYHEHHCGNTHEQSDGDRDGPTGAAHLTPLVGSRRRGERAHQRIAVVDMWGMNRRRPRTRLRLDPCCCLELSSAAPAPADSTSNVVFTKGSSMVPHACTAVLSRGLLPRFVLLFLVVGLRQKERCDEVIALQIMKLECGLNTRRHRILDFFLGGEPGV
jgi:hypothetical protein